MNIGHKNTCHYVSISVIRSHKSRTNSGLAFDSERQWCCLVYTQWCRFMGQEVREKRQGFGCNSARISPLRGQEFLVSISNFYPKFHVQRGGGLKNPKMSWTWQDVIHGSPPLLAAVRWLSKPQAGMLRGKRALSLPRTCLPSLHGLSSAPSLWPLNCWYRGSLFLS